MALNIGNINFGVDANTAGLQKAIKQLSQFQKKTDQVAKSQAKGAQQAVAAMSRQESAIRKAFQTTKNYQKTIASSKATEKQRNIALNETSRAFIRLTKELTTGKLSVEQYNRSVDAFNARLGRSKRALTDVSKAAGASGAKMQRFGVILRDLESSAVLALGPLSGVGARIRSLSAIFGRSTLMVAAWVSGIAIAVIGISKLAAGAVRAKSEMQGLAMRFEAATGSAEAGNKEYEFTLKLSKRLGLEVRGLARSYSRFLAASQGTNLEGEKSRKIFTQIAKAAAALKLDAADTEGVMRALEQIMSKGTVQAEELRGQLGDRLPGAFRIAAEAMGVTTRELNKMLKAGEVISDEFLPKFGDAVEKNLGSNAANNVNTVTGATQNLKTAMFEMMLQADRLPGFFIDLFPGKDTEVTFSAAFTSMVNAATSAADSVTALGKFELFESDDADEIVQIADGFEHLRVKAAAADPVIKDLSGSFADMKEDMMDVSAELQVAQSVMAKLGEGASVKDIDFLTDVFETLPEAAELTADGIAEMATKLSDLTGLNIPASFQGIAAGMAEMKDQLRATNAEIEKARDFPEAMAGINESLGLLRDRLAALKEGGGAIDVFDDITAKGRDFEKVLKEVIDDEDLRNKILAEYLTLITQIGTAEKARTENARQAKSDAADLARRQEQASKAIASTNHQLDTMAARIKVLNKGPDSLEFFDKITAPMMAMEKRLIDQNVVLADRNKILERYKILLEEQFVATNRLQRASDQAAAAITSTFEALIIKGGSVKEMLKALAMELVRIWFQAQVLDGLKSFLGGAIGGIFAPVTPGVGGGGGTGGSGGLINGGPFATGGSFKLPGSGGGDSVPFFGMGKPGETVSVTRPDQAMPGGGGGGRGGVIVNQYNTFENSTPDPAVLIPILEENNRKLQGEILDGLDRGSFA